MRIRRKNPGTMTSPDPSPIDGGGGRAWRFDFICAGFCVIPKVPNLIEICQSPISRILTEVDQPAFFVPRFLPLSPSVFLPTGRVPKPWLILRRKRQIWSPKGNTHVESSILIDFEPKTSDSFAEITTKSN